MKREKRKRFLTIFLLLVFWKKIGDSQIAEILKLTLSSVSYTHLTLPTKA